MDLVLRIPLDLEQTESSDPEDIARIIRSAIEEGEADDFLESIAQRGVMADENAEFVVEVGKEVQG